MEQICPVDFLKNCKLHYFSQIHNLITGYHQQSSFSRLRSLCQNRIKLFNGRLNRVRLFNGVPLPRIICIFFKNSTNLDSFSINILPHSVLFISGQSANCSIARNLIKLHFPRSLSPQPHWPFCPSMLQKHIVQKSKCQRFTMIGNESCSQVQSFQFIRYQRIPMAGLCFIRLPRIPAKVSWIFLTLPWRLPIKSKIQALQPWQFWGWISLAVWSMMNLAVMSSPSRSRACAQSMAFQWVIRVIFELCCFSSAPYIKQNSTLIQFPSFNTISNCVLVDYFPIQCLQWTKDRAHLTYHLLSTTIHAAQAIPQYAYTAKANVDHWHYLTNNNLNITFSFASSPQHKVCQMMPAFICRIDSNLKENWKIGQKVLMLFHENQTQSQLALQRGMMIVYSL